VGIPISHDQFASIIIIYASEHILFYACCFNSSISVVNLDGLNGLIVIVENRRISPLVRTMFGSAL
jgi:hypothetical protein